MKLIASSLTAGLLALASPLTAQTLLSGNHSIDGALCAGDGCTGTETFPSDTDVKVKEFDARLLFEDNSSDGLGVATRDWRLVANQFQGPLEYFAIEDFETGREVLKVEGDAPANALYVSDLGRVGLGTSIPLAKLHLLHGFIPKIRLEQDGSQGGTPQAWEISGSSVGLIVNDTTAGTQPIQIRTGAPSGALYINSSNRIGLGTTSPEEALHLFRSDGSASVLIEETSATTSPRTLLNLRNSGRSEIVMANTSTGGEWSFGAGTNFVLKTGGINTTSAAKTKHLTLFGATGNLEITGSLTTGGGTCGGGCDRVFSDGYEVPSIAEHAGKMYTLGHLPNVGPTVENQPMNVSEKLGRMLNELEHAHIYIAQLEADLHQLREEQSAQISALAAEVAELKRN